MKYEQYVSLIRNLENYSVRHPKLYRYKVLSLIMLGYGYFLGLLALFLLLPVGALILFLLNPVAILKLAAVLFKLIWIVVPALGVFFGFLGGAIKSLFTTVPVPPGIEITRSDAPELFEFIDRTCKALKARRPSTVLVSDDFNAAVVTLPRIGLFGRKVYLLLGLPLMRSLSREEFEAVITHEIGHISGRHGDHAKWAYQLNDMWGRFIAVQAEHEHKLAALYEQFVNWFFPYFNAYSFVLMREHEREADGYAVQLLDARALGGALITLETKNARLQSDFWKSVNEENKREKKPSRGVFTRMMESLKITDEEQDKATLSEAVLVPTDYSDSHPSLAERLKTMGYWDGEDLPKLPRIPEKTSDEYFLGKAIVKCIKDFDIDWDVKVEAEWEARYDNYQKQQKRLDELSGRPEGVELSAEELYEKAALIGELDSYSASVPTLRLLIERYPEFADGLYALGGVMLNENNEEGLKLLEEAAELDPKLKLGANELAFNYLRRNGRFEEAKPYAQTAEGLYDAFQKAEVERKAVYPSDRFEPHMLTDQELAAIGEKIKYFQQIEAIYIARKVIQHLPEIPMHVLFLDLNPQDISKKDASFSQQTILEVTAERLKECSIHYFIVLGGEFAGLKGMLDQLAGARIYKRSPNGRSKEEI